MSNKEKKTESRAYGLLSYYDEEYYYELNEVTGPWKPVASKAYEELISNIGYYSYVVEDGDKWAEIIEKQDLVTAFAVSGLPFYEGEELPFVLSKITLDKDYEAYLLRDVFTHLDIYLEANLEDTYNPLSLCWGKLPSEDGKCVGPAEARLVPDAPDVKSEYEYEKWDVANIPELTRYESLLALKNMILYSNHICKGNIEFLLELDLPESLVAILSDKDSYTIPDHVLDLKGAVSDDYFNDRCAETIGLSTKDLLTKVLEAFN